MSNTTRAPRRSRTVSSERIALAVKDEGWQQFRLSLKGQPTVCKLSMLRTYYRVGWHLQGPIEGQCRDGLPDCDICVRVDNYIKALCRGGQLFAGESLQSMLDQEWRPRIKR